MNLILKRTSYTQWGINGKVYDDMGNHVCDTAENLKSHLMPGVYDLTLARHPKYKHRSVLILSPQDGKGIAYMIHGTGTFNIRDQSIIVGQTLMPGVVTKSLETHEKLVERVEKALKRKGKTKLTVKDPLSVLRTLSPIRSGNSSAD